ncbi:MAG: response regulator transcription factor [Nocardioides sp.]|uniref:response regulator n=1 Tax=Nocardioides sp. TaxID=35761 RepID=UPI0039E37D32
MIRLLIVDDDPLVRSALSLMLGGQPDLEIVGEGADGRDGVDLAVSARPDIVLMDLRMPRLSGLEATRELHRMTDPPKVIVLTTFDADEHVVGALGAGAEGFLLKDTPPAEIVAAIRKVASGEPMLSPSVTRTLLARLRADAPGADESTSDEAAVRCARAKRRLAVLTERELDVAVAVGHGLSNAEIAGDLYLSVPTVKAHVSRLLDKLGATNRVQIAICVHDAGLL